MYTVMDYITAFSAACGHRISVFNETCIASNSTEFSEGLYDSIAEPLEKLRDELDDHVESGTFMTSAFNKNVAASAHMFFELLIEHKLEPPPKEQEQTFAQEDGTKDLPRDYLEGPDDDEDDPDDEAPPDDYDFLEYAEGLAEGDAKLRHEILPDILATYERFLPKAPRLF